MIVAVHFIGLVFAIAVFGAFASACLGVVALVLAVYLLSNFEKTHRGDLDYQLHEAQQKWYELEEEWSQAQITPKINTELVQIRARIGDYQKFQQSSTKQLVSGAAELPEAEKTQLIRQATDARRRIEKEIETLFGSLRQASVGLRQRQQNLAGRSEALARQLQQTKSDLAALGSNAGAIVVLLLMTFFMPFFGAIVTQRDSSRASYPNYNTYRASGIGNTTTTTTNTTAPSALTSKNSPYPEVNIPDESITDEEIRLLPDDRKVKIVIRIFFESDTLIEQKYYIAAERWLRFALRFNMNKVRALNDLGFVLSEQGKYTESLKYLKEALKIEPGNQRAKLLMGENYMKSKKFTDARLVFNEVIENSQSSWDAYYNLGIANKELKRYDEAVEAFSSAQAIGETADGHYYLGFCLAKTGDQEGALAEYESLLRLNSEKAEQLRKDAKLKVAPPKVEVFKKESVIITGEGTGNGTGSGTSFGR